ncbi:hypothetical protein D3C80_1583930 [compost metagenome]
MPGSLRRQYENLHPWTGGVEPGDDLKTIELGNADIQNDDIRAMLARQLQRIYTIVCLRDDLIAMSLHQHAYSQANDRVIIHDQHFIHGQIQLFAVRYFVPAQ